MSAEENFLSRWSRLKRGPTEADRQDQPAPAQDAAAPSGDGAEGEDPFAEVDRAGAGAPHVETDDPGAVADHGDDGAPHGDDAATPHPAEAIDIDSLDNESDFSAFVKKGVPAALQRKALRKLWTLDPLYANLDGLNDYENLAETFGAAELLPGASAWKVGRGFMEDSDFELVNERGGYRPPEEDDDHDDQDQDEDIDADSRIAEDEDSEGEGSEDRGSEDVEAGAVAAVAAVAADDDEFDVGEDGEQA